MNTKSVKRITRTTEELKHTHFVINLTGPVVGIFDKVFIMNR